ncbi:TPA: glycosyltransferase family 4 protein [Aeromonas veronii]|nr:glycosyltransferase family 4 protein [Aeromonas veronii]
MINVNARNLSVHTTGVQRYTKKILECWRSDEYRLIIPNQPMHGIKGHLWEQLVLPSRVHGNILWSPSNTGPLALSNQVVTIHDVVPFDHPEWLNPRFVAWYNFLQPKLANKIAHVITISEFSKQRIMDVLKIPESKISVIYNGVDSVNMTEVSPVSSLDIPFKRYVLAVGSIEPRKNMPRLIAAWKLIKNRIPEDTGLIIVGAKGLSRVFSAEKDGGNSIGGTENDRVHFTGHVSDPVLASLYSNAESFCYPSLYEGFGLPPLEAMAYNIPVITSNNTAMAELCQGSATLISPVNIEEIAFAIEESLKKKNVAVMKNARKLVSELSWEKCANASLEVIKGFC